MVNLNIKNKLFADTIGFGDSENYPKFKNNERMTINFANSKYFVNHFVAETLFNFKLSFKEVKQEDIKNDWDILWTDSTMGLNLDKVF